ncbi:MAG: RHS repeat-associated core domain-containing protein [Acidobacteriaceae bacterium]
MDNDVAGELTADGLGNTYTYNADGMITASSGAQYVYDALDQRVEKTGGSNPSETIYFGGSPIALLNPSSGAWTDLIYGNGSMIAEVAGTQTATPVYRLPDHLGSLAVQTNGSGGVTGANVFLPYGEMLTSTTSDSFQFTGLPQDTENSSYHAGYRNFSTTQGRWLSPDPYNGSYDITNPQSFNRYSYVMNNPLSFVDPTGLNQKGPGSGGCDPETTDCGGAGGAGSITGEGGDNGAGYYGGTGYYVDGLPTSAGTAEWLLGLAGYGVAAGDGTFMAQWISGVTSAITQLPNGLWYMSTITGGWLITDLDFSPSNYAGYSTGFSGGGGVGNAPNNPTPAKSWWQKNWDCVANVGLPVLKNDLNPLGLGIGTAANATSQMSQANLDAAAAWSLERSLTSPLKSSVVRAFAANAEALGRLSYTLTLLNVDYALYDAISAEHQGCRF